VDRIFPNRVSQVRFLPGATDKCDELPSGEHLPEAVGAWAYHRAVSDAIIDWGCREVLRVVKGAWNLLE
jgi:hypothetical protein